MKLQNDRKPTEQTKPVATAAPKKRFRIEKLEERIAPKRPGKTSSGWSGGGSIY